MKKNFKYEQNQKAWEGFYSSFIEDYTGKGDAKMSANQYKPVILEAEKICDCLFSDMTVKHWNELCEAKPDRVNHARSFFMTCASNLDLKLDKNVAIELIPDKMRKYIQVIFS